MCTKLLVSMSFFMMTPLYAMLGSENPIKDREVYFAGLSQEERQRVDIGFDDYHQNTNTDKADYRRAFHYVALAKQEKYKMYGKFLSFRPNEGYCILEGNDLCTGLNSIGTKRCLSLKGDYKLARWVSDKNKILEELKQDYKIHLMPKGLMFDDFEELLDLFKKDTELSNLVVTFKLAYDFDDEQLKRDNDKKVEVHPKIVIYCAPGKENAQLVLDKIYERFKNKEGLDITPRRNQRVTSYIYYAQGNGGDKNRTEFKDFFEEGKIHYKLDWTTWFKCLIGGKEYGYHLNIPGQQNQETSVSSLKKCIPLLCVPVVLIIMYVYK